MQSRIIYWAITSALAGFLFGFDTVVISGAEQKIEKLWGLSKWMHGLVMGSALYGTVIGSLIGGYPTDKYGRKGTLLWIGILYFVSAVWSGLATDPYSLIIARFIGGLGVGICTVTAPLYIAEISPPSNRGLLTGMFQFNIVFGIMVAFVSNALLIGTGENAWRWMLGVEGIPALIYTGMCFTIPESPRWLISIKKDYEQGKNVLRMIMPEADEAKITKCAEEIAQVENLEEKSANSEPGKSAHFWSRRLTKPILLAFLVAFFNQLSGINAILYFAPRIFQMTGLGEQSAMLTSVGIGIANLIFTFLGLWLIDRMGRKSLLIIGSIGYIISLGLTAYGFFSEQFVIVPYCIFAFIAAHAIGQGAVIWVLISEIFPNLHRAKGQALGSFTHWIFAAGLTTVFPVLVEEFKPGYIFGFFTLMMCLQLLWVLLMVPETKGVPLEEMEKRLGISL